MKKKDDIIDLICMVNGCDGLGIEYLNKFVPADIDKLCKEQGMTYKDLNDVLLYFLCVEHIEVENKKSIKWLFLKLENTDWHVFVNRYKKEKKSPNARVMSLIDE